MKAGRLFAIASAITVLATTAHASITDIQNLAAGARAASLGNAFVAVADNGDAVFANPAGLSQIESDTRAMDPPLGTGTGLPIGMKLGFSTASGSEQGAMMRTVWSWLSNSAARLLMWSVTPPMEQ